MPVVMSVVVVVSVSMVMGVAVVMSVAVVMGVVVGIVVGVPVARHSRRQQHQGHNSQLHLSLQHASLRAANEWQGVGGRPRER